MCCVHADRELMIGGRYRIEQLEKSTRDVMEIIQEDIL